MVWLIKGPMHARGMPHVQGVTRESASSDLTRACVHDPFRNNKANFPLCPDTHHDCAVPGTACIALS